jgi:hypothetical protein
MSVIERPGYSLLMMNKALGDTMVTALELMGYEAQMETDPTEALMDFTRHPGSFDAMILTISCLR